ncbi:MAG: ABC transporter permease [Spirochaetales bacterium]|nr:ABC transporter permease [Spirochaetales bacterium]
MVGGKKQNNVSRLYLLAVFFFLYAPIGVLIVFSFNKLRSTSAWGGFSFRWYFEMFRDRQILKALYYTLTIALLSSLISAVAGTLSAVGIHRMRPAVRRIVLEVNNIPVLNPDIVTGVSLMALFTALRIHLGFITVLLSHITFSIPYVVLCILPKLREIPREVTEAAMDLGATPVYTFFHVIIPEISSGILTGFLIAFTLSVDDFVISFFTTGSGVNNLSIVVYSMARRGINPKINAVSTLLFLTVFILLIIINHRDSTIKKLEV